MRLLLICPFLILTACESMPDSITTPKQQRYYIVIQKTSQSILTGEYEPEEAMDSIYAVSDSEAYHKGFISFVANLKTVQMLKQQGIKNPPFVATGFDVLNKDGLTIKYNISETQLKAEEEFKKRSLLE